MGISFPHQSVIDQAASVQPSFLKMLLLWMLPANAPRLLTMCLAYWALFANWAASHPQVYQSSFFVLQLVIMIWSVVYSFRNHGEALYIKDGRFWSRRLLWLFLAVPMLLLHAQNISTVSDSLRRMTEVAGPGQMEEAIHALHHKVWNASAYGSSLLGVLYFSFFTLCISSCEEPVFAGFVCNSIGARWGWLAALLLTPACFCLAHLPVITQPFQIVPLYAAALTYTSIRLMSGSIFLAITAHTLINIYVMLPKWLLAWLHFRYLDHAN